MYYERKIKYLDYYEEGEKLRGGGFVKLEIKEDKFRLEISVKGLYPTDSFVRDVILRSGGTEAALGQITIRNGCGSFIYSCDVDKEMGQTKMVYAALREIRIPIGGTRELICPLAEAARSCQVQEPISGKSTSSVSMEGSEDTVKEAVEVAKLAIDKKENSAEIKKKEVTKEEAAKAEEAKAEEARAEAAKEEVEEKAPVPHTLQSEVHLASAEPDMQQGSGQKSGWGNNRESKSGDKSEGRLDSKSESKSEGSHTVPKGKTAPRLLEDKWQQLSAIYPHIQPFQDERDYLSINPSDFVLFPSKFYKAVNNSFLLHGYYNYNHLILARMEHRGEVIYYIGVPGNYYDREKQVAVMFGFESFECAAEPAKTGDFGYYMMRMEL